MTKDELKEVRRKYNAYLEQVCPALWNLACAPNTREAISFCAASLLLQSEAQEAVLAMSEGYNNFLRKKGIPVVPGGCVERRAFGE